MSSNNKNLLVAGEIVVNSEAFENLTILCDEFGSRFFGTAEEKAGADFLAQKFREYGLKNVEVEPSSLYGWRNGELVKNIGWSRGTASLELLEPLRRQLDCISLPNGPSTTEEGVTAEIFNLERGSRDYLLEHREEIRGKIVLHGTYVPVGTPLDTMDPSNLYRPLIYSYLSKFEAAGMLHVRNNYGGLPKTGSCPQGGELPALAISREASDFILRQMTKGSVRANIKIRNKKFPDATTYNIISELPGDTYPEEVILIGGHYDGHDIGQGAIDDAAGACIVLEVARALSKHCKSFKRTIRFCCFGAEEVGKLGSTGYVLKHKDEIKNIRLMFNTDYGGISSKVGHTFYTFGQEMTSYLEQVSNSIGKFDRKKAFPKVINTPLEPYADHWPFYIHGVPVAHFHDFPDSINSTLYSHTPADTVDKVDPKGLKDVSLLLALVLMKIADADEIPVKHTPVKDIIQFLEETGVAENLRLQNRWGLEGYDIP